MKPLLLCFFRGACNLTIDSTGQLDPAAPLNGDLYINNTAGTIHASWTGVAGQQATVGDRVVWDSEADAEGNQGPGAKWILIQDVSAGGVVQEIGSELPIRVNDSTGGASEARPVITIDDATDSAPGAAMQAQDSDYQGDGATERDGHPLFATPKQVLEYGGGSSGGGVDPDNDVRYVRKDAGAGDQTIESTGKLTSKGSAEFAGRFEVSSTGGSFVYNPTVGATSITRDEAPYGTVGIHQDNDVIRFTPKGQSAPIFHVATDGSASFGNGSLSLGADGRVTSVNTSPADPNGGTFSAVRSSGLIGPLWSGNNGTTQTSRIDSDGSAEFAGQRKHLITYYLMSKNSNNQVSLIAYNEAG